MSEKTQKATLAGGCFWCLEAIYQDLQGVLHVESGYTGGQVPNPDYKLVCTGTTGHAEVVQITFNPEIISYEELIRIFFTIHNPTTLNRQGADIGTQYRSGIFYHDQTQKQKAQMVLVEIESSKIWPDPIVTEITALEKFYPAEDYHQNYFKNNPYQGYCQAVIAPKVTKFRKQFTEKLKTS